MRDIKDREAEVLCAVLKIDVLTRTRRDGKVEQKAWSKACLGASASSPFPDEAIRDNT